VASEWRSETVFQDISAAWPVQPYSGYGLTTMIDSGAHSVVSDSFAQLNASDETGTCVTAFGVHW
jgi:hypothetical protein